MAEKWPAKNVRSELRLAVRRILNSAEAPICQRGQDTALTRIS
jgi:hypothetical protein